MIIISLKGGLGNQLFQYAFGRLLSIKHNAEVKYQFSAKLGDTKREYKLDFFNTKVNFASSEEVKKNKYKLGTISWILRLIRQKIFRQFNIGYTKNLLNKKEGCLEGYWQSYKYLEPIKKELQQEITLKKPIDSKFNKIIFQMNSTNSISLHIRRGDYVNDPKTKKEHYTFGMEYYDKAIGIIKEKIQNPFLFVFSDDIEWVKENLKTDLPTIFVSDPSMPDYENFMIATNCKHNIIANSSFSFWIAWLNQNPNKIVIAPIKWNNIYQREYKDLLPENWIKI